MRINFFIFFLIFFSLIIYLIYYWFRLALILASCVWIYACALTLPPLFGWGSYGPEAANISCSVSWEVHDPSTHSDTYIAFLFLFGLILPVIIIIASYIHIIFTLKKVKKRSGKIIFILISAYFFFFYIHIYWLHHCHDFL